MSEKLEGWRKEAKKLFFEEHLSIKKISDKLGVSTKSISKFLNSLPEYITETERRKANNADRKTYYKNYRRKKRDEGRYSVINKETIKREQFVAAKTLSCELYF